MQPDGDGVGTDPKHDPGLGLGEPLPGQQPEQLLIVRPEVGQGFESWALHLDRRRYSPLAPDALDEPEPARHPAPVVGDDPSRDPEEPGQRHLRVRQLVGTSPGDSERVGCDVLGISGRRDAAERIGEHDAMMAFERCVEASHR